MAGSFITPDFLAEIDAIRAIPGQMGVHTWTVALYRKVHTRDSNHGRSTMIAIEDPITVGDGYAPHVEQVSAHDVVASEGFYKTGDYRIGPLTPDYGSGGVAVSEIDPALGAEEVETLFKLTGPGVRAGGELFRKVKTETNKSTSYFIVVRRANLKP